MKLTEVKLNTANLKAIEGLAEACLSKTAETLIKDLRASQTMPFAATETITKKVYGKKGQFKKDGSEYKGKEVTETVHEGGNLQNDYTFVDNSKASQGKVAVVSDTPYARRLYFHPEYNFNKSENSNAGGEWFEPYINGAKKDYAQKEFEHLMKKGMSRIK